MMSGIAVHIVSLSGVSGRWAVVRDHYLRRISLNSLIRKIVSVTNTHYCKRKPVPAVQKSPWCITAGIRATLNHVIAKDGTTLQDALESLHLRLNVTLASQHTIVKGKTVQLPYDPTEIFTLEKWGTKYRMVNAIEGVASHIDGYYIFICISRDLI
ncbi:hypothetical protein [Symbiopectobacterium sp.]|uniref:hypothetical protein n=1 Tax=Symbiopectobacterium sp. TaxID=2952789 RepID=UPI003F304841